jgi:hypothetical protein
VKFRAELLKPRAPRLELHNTFWEWSDEWWSPAGPPLTHVPLVRRHRRGRGRQARLRSGLAGLRNHPLPLVGVAMQLFFLDLMNSSVSLVPRQLAVMNGE